jgi:hypothetical protein
MFLYPTNNGLMALICYEKMRQQETSSLRSVNTLLDLYQFYNADIVAVCVYPPPDNARRNISHV